MPNTSLIRRKPSEEGYILIWVMFLLVIFTISLSVAAPAIGKQIERDREVETMERGKQYIRAVQLYYKKFHAYPPNADALVNTNQIRFLRKKYIDPMTGKQDWKPILFGQAKTQTLGFFGQPLAGAGSAGGSVMAGVGPSGGGGIGGGAGSGGFGSSSFGSSSSGFGSSSSSFGSTGSSAGSPSDTSGSAPSTGSPGDASGSSSSGSGGTGATGASGSGGSSGNSTGLSGQTFGGAGIIGFSPASPKQSILIYKKKNHFNEWEFVYDPLTEMRTLSGNSGNIGQPASSTSTPIGGSSVGSGIGSGGNSNSPVSPPASTPETTPQQ
jgi:type II secretory pathway pseudopilin PulG